MNIKAEVFKKSHSAAKAQKAAGYTESYQQLFAKSLRKQWSRVKSGAFQKYLILEQLKKAGFNEWNNQRVYFNHSDLFSNSFVYLDLSTKKWISKGQGSRSVLSIAKKKYAEITGA